MRYGSVCSGIEAATVAWHPLGWKPSFFSEIDKFPRAVLAHHYQHVPLHGDFTTVMGDEYEPIDLLIGGTPCQSFSIAGLRGGLDDARGNLALAFLQLARLTRARWLVWENVPGVLSSNGGRDFGSILGGLVELGYGFAYRVLDAQFFGVAQRRRRVFVVGYLGDWRRAAAVLFERESLRGDHPPRRETRKETPGAATFGLNGLGSYSGGPGTLRREGGDCGGGSENLVAKFLNAKGGSGRIDGESETFIAHALRGEGFDASEDGTGRGTPIVPVCFDTTQITSKTNRSNPKAGAPCHTLAKGAEPPAIAYAIQERAVSENLENGPQGKGYQPETGYTLEARNKVQAVAWSIMPQNSGRDYKARKVDVAQPVMAGGPVGGNQGGDYIQQRSAVRRLTPRECCRLQGFPDDYLDITYRGKPAADGPKYKALGNSMAVPVMRWIGERIQAVENITQEKAA